MKKLLCFFFSLLVLSIFVGCGISSSDAENIILSKNIFPYKDQNGHFRYIKKTVKLGEHDYIELLEQKGELTLTRTSHNYGASNTGGKKDRFYAGTKLPLLKPRICYGSRLKAYFENVPLIKEYFVGIKKTWKDKRKGYENRSYCEYKVKSLINSPYYDLVKDSGGKINTRVSGEGWKSQYKNLPINEYLRREKVGKTRVLKRSFSKDSHGNWR